MSESREGRRGRGTEGAAGTAIGRGQACREGDGVDRVAGGRRKWKSQAENRGGERCNKQQGLEGE